MAYGGEAFAVANASNRRLSRSNASWISGVIAVWQHRGLAVASQERLIGTLAAWVNAERA
jgi:hypothetical protein